MRRAAASSAPRLRPKASRRSPAAPRYAAHRRPPAPPRARLRPCRRHRSNRRQGRRPRARPAGDRRSWSRCDGPPLSDDDRRSLRRRPGRYRDTGAGLSEPRDTLEEVVEPYLIQLGLIARTARGRCLNGRGWTHLGLSPPSGAQTGLFDPGEQMMFLSAALLALQASRPTASRRRLQQAGQLALPPGRYRPCTTPMPPPREPAGYGFHRIAPVAKAHRSTASRSTRPCRATPALTATVTPAVARKRRVVTPVRPLLRRLPDLRPGLPLDDARCDTLRRRGRRHQAGNAAYRTSRCLRQYLAHHNQGRPYVLIGHSQGSLMPAADRARDRGQARAQRHEAGDPPRLQPDGAARQAGRRHSS